MAWNAGDQLALVERLCEVVVGARGQAAHLVVGLVHAREDEHRRADLGRPQTAHDIEPLHVWQAEIEDHDVEIVVLGEVNGVLTGLGLLVDDALAAQGGIDQLGRDRIVLNNQSSHSSLLHARSRGSFLRERNANVTLRGSSLRLS
jgi:hypothetical protein